MVTPFTPQLEVDYAQAARLARHLRATGTDTIVVAGTTGESPTLSAEEKLRLLEVVKEAVGDSPVVCGTGTNCTQATIDFSLRARERGASALLVVTPYYNKPPQDALLEHYRSVAQATQLPIIAYNIPSRTGVEMAPATLAQMAEIPNLIAVKESLSHLEAVSILSSLLEGESLEGARGFENFVERRPLEIYSGDDIAILPILAVGGVGVISVAAHVAGNLIREMIEAYFAGRVERAKELHLRLFPLFSGLFAVTNPILIKEALALQGWEVGALRPPLRRAHPQEREALRQIMERAGLL